MRFGKVRVTAIICCTMGVASTDHAAAIPPTYTLTDLGTLPGISGSHLAVGLNASGQVSGFAISSGMNRPFLWTPKVPNGRVGSMIDLGDLPTATLSIASGINDLGQVVGRSSTNSAPGRLFSAFLWSPNTPNGTSGSMVDISRPTGSGDDAYAINASGQVTGMTAGGSQQFLWTPTTPNGTSGSMVLLGTLPNTEESFPGDINARGQIPGSSWNGPYHANLWSPDTPNASTGSMIDLGDLSGGTDLDQALGINDAGRVVGWGQIGGVQHAFVWIPTTPNGTTGSMADLGTLATPANHSTALGINSFNRIVGRSEVSSGVDHAFTWTADDGMLDLNGLLDGDGAGWVLRSAVDINDAGQIICEGRFESGSGRAVLLTPVVPEPSVLGLLAGCSALVLRRRRTNP